MYAPLARSEIQSVPTYKHASSAGLFTTVLSTFHITCFDMILWFDHVGGHARCLDFVAIEHEHRVRGKTRYNCGEHSRDLLDAVGYVVEGLFFVKIVSF